MGWLVGELKEGFPKAVQEFDITVDLCFLFKVLLSKKRPFYSQSRP